MNYYVKNDNKSLKKDLVQGETQYQLSLLSKFFTMLVTIYLIFFFTRHLLNFSVLAVYVKYNNISLDFIHNISLQILMLIEFITFLIFYNIHIKKNKEKENLHIIRIWFYSYLSLSLFWVLMINSILYIIFDNNSDSLDYRVFSNELPYTYIIFSSIIITIAIYLTGTRLYKKSFKVAALGYPLIPLLLILFQELIISTGSTYIARIDIITTLYNIYYIVWLYILNNIVKNYYNSF